MQQVKHALPTTAARNAFFALVFFLFSDALIKRYVTVSHFSANPIYPYFILAVFVTLLGSGYYIFTFFRRTTFGEIAWERASANTETLRHQKILLLLIFSLGIFLRFWKLDSLYDGLWYDEAYKGLDAIAIRVFGEHPLFLNWNGPREALVAWLVAGCSFLLGYSTFAIRAVEALAGVGALIFFYLFVKKIFNARLALLTTFLLAVSKQHLIYSRLGYRISLSLLFELATLFLVAYGLKEPKKKAWPLLLAGLIGGLGFYTYISYRIFPVVILAFLLDSGIRKKARERFSHLLIALVLSAAVLTPLAFFFVKHPESFTYRLRSTGLSINRSEPLPQLLLRTGKDALGMFTFIGDPFSRQNVNAEQELSPFITGFFLLGLILTLKSIRKPFAMFLLVWLIIGLLPTVFSLPSPHAGRALGALPPALIFAGLGLFAAFQILSQTASFLIRPLLFVVLGGALLTGPNDALFRYSNYLDYYDPDAGMNRLEYNITKLVESGGTKCRYYLSPQFFFHASVEYLSYPNPSYKLFNYHTRFDPDRISIVVLGTEPRLLWWLTDSDEKNFFKWWQQHYGFPIPDIRKWNAEMYDLPPKLPQSDAPLLNRLKHQYPNGKEVRFDYFTLFVFESSP